MYKGACLCGAVRYEVDALEPKMAHCHCSMCRKFHGAAFATFGEARVENFRWVAGEEFLNAFVADNGTTRRFCGKCGSSMTFSPHNDEGEFVEFALSSLDSDIDLKPDAHIFVDYKASWFDITDTLPQFAESRGSEKRK